MPLVLQPLQHLLFSCSPSVQQSGAVCSVVGYALHRKSWATSAELIFHLLGSDLWSSCKLKSLDKDRMWKLYPKMLYAISLLFVLTYFDSPQWNQAVVVSALGSTMHTRVCTHTTQRYNSIIILTTSLTSPFTPIFPFDRKVFFYHQHLKYKYALNHSLRINWSR